MASETGKTLSEGDVEVSEATDFAHYYAERALDLERVPGALFVPTRLTVVAPPWNFPVAIPAGSVLSALAAGSAVILKPAPQARRCAAVLAEALWEAGIPRALLTLVDIEEGELGRQLISDPTVGRVILTGAWETANLFRSWRSDLPLLAETSGKNAIIVTPSADLDLAVADVVKSAFGHAGQKCSAASLAILVGSVATSERFKRQLVDSVRTLRVGLASDARTQMGPIIEPATGKLLSALTTLEEGEEWLVKPRQLDETGRLWSPGVRTGVAAGSAFHRTEYFGPVLGIMTAATLDEAIELQNATDYGLTAGIHSLDPDEVMRWTDQVDAGNLYVNRGITGAIVRRQPFGGWKRSTVGASAKAGGPNYLMTLGSWQALESDPGEDLTLEGISEPVARVIKRAQAGLEFLEFDRVRLAAVRDEKAWLSEFGVSRDVSNLGVERNVFRYRPLPITIRLSEGGSMGDLVRLIVAATRAGSALFVSSSLPLPQPLVDLFGEYGSPTLLQSIIVETDARWHARLVAGELKTTRIRLIGGNASALAGIVKGNPDVAIYGGPVTTAGRVELLPFVHEQAVSVTAHRFGNPDHAMASLPL
jgi:RHH-type proline utilization regulon transcriptional repressor/proline dehydrogenase/delta 1-pyrroline-5-carboxylate dehydrogenase